MSGQNVNTKYTTGKKNSLNLYNNSKLEKYISSYNRGVTNPKSKITELISDKNHKNKDPLKAREEGFNVYLMGANEERIKNMRKKEQLDVNSKKRLSNSRSIARKNWESNNIISGFENIISNPIRMLEKETEKKESRSIGRILELKSAGKEIKDISDNNNNNNIKSSNIGNNYSMAHLKKNSQNIRTNSRTKESLANIQSVLNNINFMNKNVGENLKKLNNLESPHSGNGPHTKRFRNYQNKPNFSIGYPNLTLSAGEDYKKDLEKHSDKDQEIRTPSENMNLDADILDNDLIELNEKISSDINNVNELENLNQDKEYIVNESKSKEISPILAIKNLSGSSINCNNSNLSLINPIKNSQNFLKTSNISLKNSKILAELESHTNIIGEFKKSSINNKDLMKRDNSNIIIHNFINKEMNNKTIQKLSNDSVALKNVWNNKTLNTTNDLLHKYNRKDSNILTKNLDDSQDKTDDFSYALQKIGSSLSPKKKILSAFPSKGRTKSSHKPKQIHEERPYSSILHLINPKNLKTNKKPGIVYNKSSKERKSLMSSNNQNIRKHYDNIYNLENKGGKLNLIPSIQFIYKSPQNKSINKQSDLQKTQQTIRKNSNDRQQLMKIVNDLNTDNLKTTRDHLISLNTKDKTEYFSNSSHKNLTIEYSKLNNRHLSSNTFINSNNPINRVNPKKNSKILQHFNPSANANSQHINKLPNLSNNNSSSNSNSNNNYPAIGSHSNSDSRKKIEILSKIEKLNEKKLHKLAKVLEELANHSGEISQLSLQDSKQFKDSSSSSKNMQNLIFRNMTEKYNINYINSESVNIGNININVNNKSNEATNNFHKVSTDRSNLKNFSLKVKNNKKTFEDFINEEYVSPRFQNEKKINFLDRKVHENNQTPFSPSKMNSHQVENKNQVGNFSSLNSLNSNTNTINNTPSANLMKNSIKSFFNQSFKSSVNKKAINSALTIKIFSNWGNKEKLGLTEIQLFDSKNRQIEIVECQIKNGTTEGSANLYNNKYFTTDENFMWISPNCLNKNENLTIQLFHQSPQPVENVVIWNFNSKDLTKGVKEAKIESDGSFWRGIINIGSFNPKIDYSMRIKLDKYLDNAIEKDYFPKNSKSDKNLFFSNEDYEREYIKYELTNPGDSLKISNTFEGKNNLKYFNPDIRDSKKINSALSSKFQDNKRETNPITNILANSLNMNPSKLLNNHAIKDIKEPINRNNSARNNCFSSFGNLNNLNINKNSENYDSSVLKLSNCYNGEKDFIKIDNRIQDDHHPTDNERGVLCNRIKIILSSNYGDKDYVGLTGIQFLDSDNKIINIEEAKSIGALPKDINTAFENCGDPRIFENVFNEINEVSDDSCMWLTPYNPFSPPFLELEFECTIYLSSIKLWNYNRSDQLNRGTRTIEIIIDEDYSNAKSVILRRGIGETGVDYSQTIYYPFLSTQFSQVEMEIFNKIKPASLSFEQDYETPYLPTGLLFKIVVHSNWGDPNEVGLNRIEFFDQNGNLIFDDDSINNKLKILAIPSYSNPNNCESTDVKNILNIQNSFDSNNKNFKNTKWISKFINTRVAEIKKDDDSDLISPLYNTFSKLEKNLEIKKYLENKNNPNCVYFLFNKPISISYIRFWNLDDSPSKGCKDIDILCDDKLIYKGILKKAIDDFSYSTIILFTSDEQIIKNIDENLLNPHKNHKYNYSKYEVNNCYVMSIDEGLYYFN